MRAVLVRHWKPFHELEIENLPDPEPGPKQLRIRVQATGVSFATSLVVEGRYQRKPPRPFTPGTEVAGIVEAVGTEVTRFRPGDRVMAALDWGGLAEKALAFEVNSFAIPDGVSFARAVPVINSYATAGAALLWPHLLRLAAGETLLVHGAAGAVGLAGVEIGKALGARVVATAGSDEKVALTLAHGADHAINYRDRDFREAVLGLTGGKGVDAVLDPVGGDVFDQSLRCMAPEGRIAPVGFAAGRIPQIPANILLVKNLSVVGLNLGYYYGWSPYDARYDFEDRVRELIGRLFDWLAAGRLDPVVEDVLPLDGFRDAMALVLGRRSKGKVVLAMNEEAVARGL
ncbi:MAG: NADPH:quinone oxidoreductase family protein [Alphaproteobacteria bacterium]